MLFHLPLRLLPLLWSWSVRRWWRTAGPRIRMLRFREVVNARHRMLLSVETMTSRVSQISQAETELSAPEEDRINLLGDRAHSEAAATLPDGWDAPATPDLDITQGFRDGASSNPPGVASGGLSCDGSCACPAPPSAPLSLCLTKPSECFRSVVSRYHETL